ncbi:hypothetical protein [Rossellomorea marisflavi]|uniref:hypothetical protein n=1 Tax=Rossellomorea marisflavi TaxID=189381 RepID=UPI00064F6A83|nr:hypothetical protein [Rossellomorea marisflavi]KML32363.1 hypothetical protein VL12_15290 [Rossellomorea marisflavi]
MLWMVRAFPNKVNRMEEFLSEGIIAVYWGVGDLTDCNTKSEVASVVRKTSVDSRNTSLQIGLLNSFVNRMSIGDYCIVPHKKRFFVAKITSDYFYNQNSSQYEHQRKAEWLFNGKSLEREDLPEKLQNSTRTMLGLANLSKHYETFIQYLDRKNNTTEDSSNEEDTTSDELSSLVTRAISILKDEIASDDPDRRLKAAIAVMDLSNRSSL